MAMLRFDDTTYPTISTIRLMEVGEDAQLEGIRHDDTLRFWSIGARLSKARVPRLAQHLDIRQSDRQATPAHSNAPQATTPSNPLRHLRKYDLHRPIEDQHDPRSSVPRGGIQAPS